MTVKDFIELIEKELCEKYPSSETSSMAHIILNTLLKFNKMDIFQNASYKLSTEITTQIYNIIEQLKHDKPLQYVLGETEFFGLIFEVNPSVLIPRGETEELVDWIRKDYQDSSPRILDIGCGSGCIAISLKKHLPSAHVWAMDISALALETANRNAIRNATEIQFIQGDILQENSFGTEFFDIIVSNPPYVTLEQQKKMARNVVDFEPHLALFVPKDDPLVFYKAIAKFAREHLSEKGTLYVEINEELHEETSEVIAGFGFFIEKRHDIHTRWRMIKAMRYDQ